MNEVERNKGCKFLINKAGALCLRWRRQSLRRAEGPATQPYKYNSKEFVEMHGFDSYDSDARMYYPAMMRTMTMDPLAEKYYSVSPYAWCLNNPVRNVDPTGMWIQYNDSTGYYRYENGQWYQYQQQGKDIGKYTAYTPQQGSFLDGVLAGLNALASKSETGKALLDFFANDNNDVFIKQWTENAVDLNSHDIFLDTNFQGSIIPCEGGLQKSPFWLDIGHELAHQQDVQKNGSTQANLPWITLPNGKVISVAEKYATHMENQMRADAGMSLRTHYISQGFWSYAPSQILNNGVSIFFGTDYRMDAISRKLNSQLRLRTP